MSDWHRFSTKNQHLTLLWEGRNEKKQEIKMFGTILKYGTTKNDNNTLLICDTAFSSGFSFLCICLFSLFFCLPNTAKAALTFAQKKKWKRLEIKTPKNKNRSQNLPNF